MGKGAERETLPMPPALETAAARVPLEVPSMGALMMMGCWACGNQVLSLETIMKEVGLISNAGKRAWC
jgi:hypothetical protein